MDTILQDAIQFIFVPESTMSVFFLFIFVVCFIYGTWISVRCLKQWREFQVTAMAEYNKVKTCYNPGKFIDIFQTKITPQEDKMTDLSNVFVTIGILGTFIGLGIAIQGAAELLSDENIDIAKLNGVLGVIAFKFQISVWGTIFSLLFKKIIEDYYNAHKYEIISILMGNLYANEKDIRTTLTEHLSIVSNMNSLEEKHLTEIINMRDHFGKYVDLATDFATNVERFGKRVDDYHKDWLNSQENLKNSAQEAAVAFINCVKDIQTKISKNQESMAGIQQEIQVNISRSITTLRKAFVRSEDEYMRVAQESFNAMLKKSLIEIKEGYNSAADRLSQVVTNLDCSLNNVKGAADTIQDNSLSAQKEFSSVATQLMEINKNHQNNIQKCYEQLIELWGSIKDKEMSKQQVVKDMVGSIHSQLDNLTTQIKDDNNELKPNIKQLHDLIDKEFKNHNDHMDKVNDKFNTLINKITDNTKIVESIPNKIAEEGVEKFFSYPVFSSKK